MKLTFLEDAVEINFYSMDRLSLALVDGHGPRPNKWATEAGALKKQTKKDVVPPHS